MAVQLAVTAAVLPSFMLEPDMSSVLLVVAGDTFNPPLEAVSPDASVISFAMPDTAAVHGEGMKKAE